MTRLKLAKIVLAATFSWVITTCLKAQEVPPSTPNNLALARDFLRSFYPQLSGRSYFLTVNTSLKYDAPPTLDGLLRLSVGEVPDEKPSHTPIQSRQLLTAQFQFDGSGHLVSFSAEGAAVGDPAAKANFAKSADHLNGSQISAALKQAGAKYGPDAKDEFASNLPTAKLETFLGKLTILSVNFAPYLASDRSNYDDDMRWQVKASAKRSDGTEATYRLEFEQYRGDIVGACDVSIYPCNLMNDTAKK